MGIILVFIFAIVIIGLAQAITGASGQPGLSHSRLQVLSPKIKSQLVEAGTDFKRVFHVYVSGNKLTPDAMEDLGAFSALPLTKENSLYVTATLNAILNISSLSNVSYIREEEE